MNFNFCFSLLLFCETVLGSNVEVSEETKESSRSDLFIATDQQSCYSVPNEQSEVLNVFHEEESCQDDFDDDVEALREVAFTLDADLNWTRTPAARPVSVFLLLRTRAYNLCYDGRFIIREYCGRLVVIEVCIMLLFAFLFSLIKSGFLIDLVALLRMYIGSSVVGFVAVTVFYFIIERRRIR